MFKNRSRVKNFLRMVVGSFLGLVLVLMSAFLWWRVQENRRIESGSEIMETAHGPIEYATFGEGTAVLVLHGTIGGYDQGVVLAEMVDTEDHQFISVSRPGYLRTPLDTGATFPEQADAYAALLDELGIEQVALMAISGGGPPALQFALRHPERTWGLVMIATSTDVAIQPDTPTRVSEEPDTDVTVTESGPPPLWIINVFFSDVTSWLATTIAKWQPRWVLPAIVGENYVETVMNDPIKYALFDGFVDSFALTSQRRVGSFSDGQEFLQHTGYPFETITAPILILQGTKDDIDLELQQKYLDEITPNSTYIEIEDGTHFMPASHNEILAPIIQDFLAQHSPN